MRTTIDLDPAVLAELKQRAADERKTLGQLATELLTPALKTPHEPPAADFAWRTTHSAMLIDIEDKDALRKVLDER